MKIRTALLCMVLFLVSCSKTEIACEKNTIINQRPPIVELGKSTNSCLSLNFISKELIHAPNGITNVQFRTVVNSPNNGVKTMVMLFPSSISQTPVFKTYHQVGNNFHSFTLNAVNYAAITNFDSITVKHYNGPLNHYQYTTNGQQPCVVERMPVRELIVEPPLPLPE